MDQIFRITPQVKAPRGKFPGKVIEGYYRIIDNAIAFTDAGGKPLDNERRPISPDDDHRLIACSLLKRRRSDSSLVKGFNDRLVYPRLGRI